MAGIARPARLHDQVYNLMALGFFFLWGANFFSKNRASLHSERLSLATNVRPFPGRRHARQRTPMLNRSDSALYGLGPALGVHACAVGFVMFMSFRMPHL